MKVLFLDFDGVLNSNRYYEQHKNDSETGVVIDPVRLGYLRQIVEATGAKIVLSTSWREHWQPDEASCGAAGREINRIFGEQGLSVYDKTEGRQMGEKPYDARVERGGEITRWLEAHPQVTDYVVIDDMAFEDGLFEGHNVRTAGYRGGLTEDDVREAIRLLNHEQ